MPILIRILQYIRDVGQGLAILKVALIVRMTIVLGSLGWYRLSLGGMEQAPTVARYWGRTTAPAEEATEQAGQGPLFRVPPLSPRSMIGWLSACSNHQISTLYILAVFVRDGLAGLFVKYHVCTSG